MQFAWIRLRAGFAALAAVMFAALPLAVMATPNGPDRPATLELLAFGDSLVHGYGLTEGDTFPAQLEAALRARGHAVDVVNGGNSGDTTEAGRARLDWAMRDSVDAAIVVLGANDALRGIDPAVTRRNLDAILGKLEEKGVPALLAGMKAPRNMGADYVDSFDGLYPSLARHHDVVYYPFFLKGVATDRELNQADGIHPNAEGVAVIVENILPKVEELIQKARNGRETQG